MYCMAHAYGLLRRTVKHSVRRWWSALTVGFMLCLQHKVCYVLHLLSQTTVCCTCCTNHIAVQNFPVQCCVSHWSDLQNNTDVPLASVTLSAVAPQWSQPKCFSVRLIYIDAACCACQLAALPPRARALLLGGAQHALVCAGAAAARHGKLSSISPPRPRQFRWQVLKPLRPRRRRCCRQQQLRWGSAAAAYR